MALPLIVFDCDGTLVDSQAMILASMASAFADAGLTMPDEAAVRHVVGLSLDEAMAALSPELAPGERAGLAASYKRAFFELRMAGGVEDRLYPGIAALLAELDQAGYLLGVATGKSRRGLNAVLANYGLTELFVTLQTADHHPSKPHPSMLLTALAEAGSAPHSAVMIGDTSYDMAMARAAGMAGLGVGWGYHPPNLLVDAGALGVADSSDALRAMIAARVTPTQQASEGR